MPLTKTIFPVSAIFIEKMTVEDRLWAKKQNFVGKKILIISDCIISVTTIVSKQASQQKTTSPWWYPLGHASSQWYLKYIHNTIRLFKLWNWYFNCESDNYHCFQFFEWLKMLIDMSVVWLNELYGKYKKALKHVRCSLI